MVAVLDTNIVIDYLRGEPNIVFKVEQCTEIHLPVWVCGELLFGASIAANAPKHLEKVNDFIGRSQVMLPDLKVAQAYARVRKHLKDSGRPIPENDIWIAAAALANDLRLVTRDKHFLNIPFLDLEVWA